MAVEEKKNRRCISNRELYYIVEGLLQKIQGELYVAAGTSPVADGITIGVTREDDPGFAYHESRNVVHISEELI